MYQATDKHPSPFYKTPIIQSIFAFFYLCLSVQLFALPEDNKQPLNVRADSADLSQSKHLGTYLGHVAIDQGSTHIRSHKTITLGNAQNKLLSAIFEGSAEKQAHYWTKETQKKTPTTCLCR